ncbi:hypothetical protein [Pandoravirus japonicus]|uniref:Uncharacterized protein n=1 Tax=Pandoravirus japonicus TaxID=2823154 RepID=A0A811BR91_9VIRU|nr:hypothetical protein [Pandoravirus japonicus]
MRRSWGLPNGGQRLADRLEHANSTVGVPIVPRLILDFLAARLAAAQRQVCLWALCRHARTAFFFFFSSVYLPFLFAFLRKETTMRIGVPAITTRPGRAAKGPFCFFIARHHRAGLASIAGDRQMPPQYKLNFFVAIGRAPTQSAPSALFFVFV